MSSSNAFLLLLGFIVNGLIYVNMSSWEKLYGLTSKQTALIPALYDFFGLIVTPLLGYYGRTVHNGRLLAFCAFMMGLGSFTMLLPHLISDPYKLGPQPIETCDLSGMIKINVILLQCGDVVNN